MEEDPEKYMVRQRNGKEVEGTDVGYKQRMEAILQS